MLISEQERTEGQLIHLTDEMANLALYPLTRATAEKFRHLAGKVAELAGDA